jgi:hypothetical protein
MGVITDTSYLQLSLTELQEAGLYPVDDREERGEVRGAV